MAGKPRQYDPPDPTRIDVGSPQAVRFWSGTLDKSPDRIREAVQKVGPMLEDVKRELGISGV